MISKIYISPQTFETSVQEFEDFHFELAERIKKILEEIKDMDISFITNVISNEEANKLMIGIMKTRKIGQEISEKYRITIEKI